MGKILTRIYHASFVKWDKSAKKNVRWPEERLIWKRKNNGLYTGFIFSFLFIRAQARKPPFVPPERP